jgi:hypothetical protein
MRGGYRIIGGFVGKSEGRRALGRPRRRWGIILKLMLKKWF